MPLALATALVLASGPVPGAAPAPARAAGPARVTLVACAPGYPGTTAEAQPSMDAFAATITRAAGWSEGAVAGVYIPTEQDGLARLRASDAAVALVPLPFWVKHHAELALTPRLAVVAEGEAAPTGTWALVARKGRVTSPASLAAFTVVSIAGYAPEFVRGALATFGPLPRDMKIVESAQVLSWLRKIASGADAAALLDPQQTAALTSLPFAGELEVVARSAPLPTAFVATIGTRLPSARWSALERAFLSVGREPQPDPALRAIRMIRFVPVDPAAVTAAKTLARAP